MEGSGTAPVSASAMDELAPSITRRHRIRPRRASTGLNDVRPEWPVSFGSLIHRPCSIEANFMSIRAIRLRQTSISSFHLRESAHGLPCRPLGETAAEGWLMRLGSSLSFSFDGQSPGFRRHRRADNCDSVVILFMPPSTKACSPKQRRLGQSEAAQADTPPPTKRSPHSDARLTQISDTTDKPEASPLDPLRRHSPL